MSPETENWPNLLLVDQFLDAATCRLLVTDMLTAKTSAATVYGRSSSGAVDESARRTLSVTPSTTSRILIREQLESFRVKVEQHFHVSLNEIEEPQFLRYRVGDFFVAHQDGNTGLLRLDTEARRVSVVIFLSRESDVPETDAFCGGSLLFRDLRREFRVTAEPGRLVAFRAETTHEVTPVTHGERLSIASWYR